MTLTPVQHKHHMHFLTSAPNFRGSPDPFDLAFPSPQSLLVTSCSLYVRIFTHNAECMTAKHCLFTQLWVTFQLHFCLRNIRSEEMHGRLITTLTSSDVLCCGQPLEMADHCSMLKLDDIFLPLSISRICRSDLSLLVFSLTL